MKKNITISLFLLVMGIFQLIAITSKSPLPDDLLLTKEVKIQNPQYLAMLHNQQAIQNFESNLMTNKYVANVELNATSRMLQICFQESLVTDLVGTKNVSDEMKNKMVNEFMDDFVSIYADPAAPTTGTASNTGGGIRNVEMLMGIKNVPSVVAVETHSDAYEVKTLSQTFFNALPAQTQQLVRESQYYKIEE